MKEQSCNLLLSDYDRNGRVYSIEMYNAALAEYIREEGQRHLEKISRELGNFFNHATEPVLITSRKELTYSAQEFFYDLSFSDY